ncbi:MAG: MFS transporter, partial [Candidatus Kariarchaeaceae archaeon]
MADVLKLNTLSYIVIFGASIINLAAGILEPTIAPYLEELGASSQKIGEILAAQWLVVALASIPFALLSTQIGYVRVLYISGVTSIIGGFVLVFMDGIPAVHLFYYIIGLSFAAASGPAAAILAENEGSKRIAAFALFSTTWMIPPALGAGISAWWFRGVDDYAPETISTIFPITLLVLVIGVFPFMVLLFLHRRHDQVTQPEEEVIP